MSTTPVPQHKNLARLSVAAAYRDVHPTTVRRWIAAGHIAGYRVGPRLLMVDLDELDAALVPVAGV